MGDGAIGQRQSTPPWLGLCWGSGRSPGRNCPLFLLCSNSSFPTERPGPTSSASSKGQHLSRSRADPAAWRDSRGKTPRLALLPPPELQPQGHQLQAAGLTPRSGSVSSLHPDRGTAEELCSSETVTQNTSREIGNALTPPLHPLPDPCWGAAQGVVCPHTALCPPALDPSGERARQKQESLH